MSAREQLNAYMDGLERRLRLGAILRGAAVLVAAALAATVVLVLIINRFAFSGGSLTGARGILILTLALLSAFALVIPLWRLNRRSAVGKAESAFPQFQQRLITYAERDHDGHEPFLELLAADTMAAARDAEPGRLVRDKVLLVSLGIGAASLGTLIWLVLAGPGFLGYGAALLWKGQSRGAAPLYDIRVSPGDATVRRNADELVTAQPIGIQTDKVRLYARYQSASKWEQLNMQPQPGASGFQFTFAGLPEGVEYYVEAGPLRSRHFNIRVADLPSIKQIRVTYHFPSWTGLQNAVEEHGGDLRAIEGTQASLEILTDRPLRDGVLVLDDQRQIQVSGGEGGVYQGSIRIEKDGAYHVAALDQGQPVRLSEDFFIEASKANPPEVVITRPGRDYQASPIEEVTVSVKADDEFGLNDFELHYSVNGSAEQTVNLLKQKGGKTADGSAVIHLEDFKVVPGDIVSLYATAKDPRADSRTDMFFIQAEPFEREYSQSQQSGGGGGGGGGAGNQSEISQREKEIIAATWKQQGDKNASPEKSAENAKFLSGVQAKLREQALSLAGRLQMRDLTQQNAEFSEFQQDMSAAAAAMDPASQKLQQQKWNDAIPGEQKALQYLLRAEATFRQIEVAFGNSGGGGGGGSAGRDLASLFDLELDTQKNQYETAQTAGSASQRNEEIDEALRKLDELARRQQELADQQRSNNGQAFEQRWQQEMLRRQAEELQRQIEQLSQSSQQNTSASNGQSSASDSQGGSDSRAQQALDRLRQANDDMRRAASQEQNNADARRAADRLREAQSLLGGMQHQAVSGRLDSLADKAQKLAKEQQEQTDRMQRAFGKDDSADSGEQSQNADRYQKLGQLADDRQRLADDLARLEKEMRDAENGLAAASNRPAASKLRDALGDLDESDLETRIQRSADRLRRGVNPDSNSGESEIASGLQHLGDQIGQARQALGDGGQQASESALDQVERLRNRLQALDRNVREGSNSNGRQGQSGQPGAGQGAGRTDDNGVYGGNRGGYSGDGRNNWWIDTGNNSTAGPKTVAPPASPVSSDPEAAYQQGLNDLNQLRQSVQDDPDTLRQVRELIREMQRLDPKRFPGNPQLVEQLHAQVLNDVDKLELQLRRQADDKESGQIRSGDSLPVPSGYQDAVAEYFRRLSKRPPPAQ